MTVESNDSSQREQDTGAGGQQPLGSDSADYTDDQARLWLEKLVSVAGEHEKLADATDRVAQLYTQELIDGFRRRAHIALGYTSWRSFCEAKLVRFRPSILARREISLKLAKAGMSTWDAAATLGVDQKTVRNDRAALDEENSSGPAEPNSVPPAKGTKARRSPVASGSAVAVGAATGVGGPATYPTRGPDTATVEEKQVEPGRGAAAGTLGEGSVDRSRPGDDLEAAMAATQQPRSGDLEVDERLSGQLGSDLDQLVLLLDRVTPPIQTVEGGGHLGVSGRFDGVGVSVQQIDHVLQRIDVVRPELVSLRDALRPPDPDTRDSGSEPNFDTMSTSSSDR